MKMTVEKLEINQTAFWAYVNEEEKKIAVAARAQKSQPLDGQSVYITSLEATGWDPKHPGLRGGIVCLAGCSVKDHPLKLAAQRIVDGSHRLSTDDEIDAYKRDQIEKGKAIRGEVNKTTLVFPAARPASEAVANA
jgi:hypothetical protein